MLIHNRMIRSLATRRISGFPVTKYTHLFPMRKKFARMIPTSVRGLKTASNINTVNSKSNAFEEFDDAIFVGMNGGQIFEEVLRQLGVTNVFGYFFSFLVKTLVKSCFFAFFHESYKEIFSTCSYPGGAILPVFDGIHDSPYFQLTIPRHEQGAGHMAEG